MTKDYLKFRNAIKKDNDISIEEAYLLETLFDYYNINCGYAYPSYDILMSDLKTKRRAKISKILKSLVKKGYILISKVGKKNTYKLLKYLFLSNTKKVNVKKEHTPVDSNGNKPLDGQSNIDEAIENTEVENIVGITGLDKKEAAKLLEVAENDVSKVVKAFEYAKEKGKAVFNYIKWVINNIHVVKEKSCAGQSKRELKMPFCDYEQRQYSDEYLDNLEKRLLGWC